MNSDEIVTWNVFKHSSFSKEVYQLSIEHRELSLSDFSEKLKRICRYYYWSKCEWEVVVTSWPPRVSEKELERLNKEKEEYLRTWGKELYSLIINPETGKKVDVYSQLALNWDVFVKYVWEKLYSSKTNIKGEEESE